MFDVIGALEYEVAQVVANGLAREFCPVKFDTVFCLNLRYKVRCICGDTLADGKPPKATRDKMTLYAEGIVFGLLSHNGVVRYRKFTAVDSHGHSITTIGSENKERAAERLEYELSKPGRSAYLSAWIHGGRMVKVDGGEPVKIDDLAF